MEDEASSRLDRPSVVDRAIGRFSGIDSELLQKGPEAKPRPLVADSNSDRAILVMNAHGDHCSFEARVGHARHGQKQLAGQERRTFHVANDGAAAADRQGRSPP
jgi:hypothetical protein